MAASDMTQYDGYTSVKGTRVEVARGPSAYLASTASVTLHVGLVG